MFKYRVFKGKDCVKEWLLDLEKICIILYNYYKFNLKMVDLTAVEQTSHIASRTCTHCKQGFALHNYKVKYHSHINGRYISALCNRCNILQVQKVNFLFHNNRNYDSHILMKHGFPNMAPSWGNPIVMAQSR